MKAFIAFLFVAFAAAASAESFDYDLSTDLDSDAEARLFFVNFTSSLVQVNATILAYGLLFLAIVGAAAVALYYLYLESQNTGSGYGYSYGQQQGQYGYQNYARSSKDESKFDVMKVLEWMSIAREMYDNFDYNDLECQKRLICEIVQNEPIFGTGAITIKQATRAARYLEMFTLPDEIREVVDEMMDAAARGEQNVSCGDYFRCPFSIKETTSNMLN